MTFYTEPIERTFLDDTTQAMATRPEFADRYEAIKELRELDRQGLQTSVNQASKASGFFRVASLQGPIEALAKVLDPEWLKDKNRFYRWLKQNPQHCTYERKRDTPRATFVDGKEIR